MTAFADWSAAARQRFGNVRWPWAGRTSRPARARVAATPGQQALAVGLAMLSGTVAVLLINLVGISQLQHMTTQDQLYGAIRLSLAEGSTPVGPLDANGQVVAPGTPVAIMSAPEIGIQHEVIVQGTSSAQTVAGVGYRRDSALPCQAGASVLMARSGAYGAVGASWLHLQNGDRMSFTMGEGTCTYQVSGVRYAGDKAPIPPTGTQGSLTLVTSSGLPFVPTGVVRVDATLVSGDGFARSSAIIPSSALPSSELPMGVDGGYLFGLVMLLEAIIGVGFGAWFLWRRWNRLKTALVVAPIALVLILLAATNVNYLLPNLL